MVSRVLDGGGANVVNTVDPGCGGGFKNADEEAAECPPTPSAVVVVLDFDLLPLKLILIFSPSFKG
jgi:hypothetical protein